MLYYIEETKSGLMMHYEYDTKRVCSKKILFDIEDKIVKNIKFTGGCNGNMQGMARLCEGQAARRDNKSA